MLRSCRGTVGLWLTLIVLLCHSCQTRIKVPEEILALASTLPKEIDYNFHVKPILSDRCFNCHGPDPSNRKASLRLDLGQDSRMKSDIKRGMHIIAPGKVNKSQLIHKILHHEESERMPPPESKQSLSDYEKAVLLKWIEQGAPYKEHWAYQPLDLQNLPPDHHHPVDYFIDEKLRVKNLKTVAKAAKESLIRRASFDLTGLPPTLEEIDAFVQDKSDSAFVKVLNRLLSSDSYGERMAADWMDVSRYADSDGYLDDKHREVWPWRDWVIKAFNQNMPYDQFVTWQIAGDLLPEANVESTLATTFNRLHRRNSEAGIVFEEYRTEYVADRVHTFGKAFLGLTIECARCHDHKFDPITQEEYYQLFAFFNQTDELGTAVYGPDQTPGPALLLSNQEQADLLEFFNNKVNQGEKVLQDLDAHHSANADNRLTQTQVEHVYHNKLVAYHSFDQLPDTNSAEIILTNEVSAAPPAEIVKPRFSSGIRGKAFLVEDYNYVLLGEKVGWYGRYDPFSVSLWIKPAKEYDHAGIFTHCEDLRLGYKGYSLHLQDNRLRFIMAHSWPNNSIEVISHHALAPEEWSHIVVIYDGSGKAAGVQFFVDGERVKKEIYRDNLYKDILYEPDIHTYGFAGFRLGYRDKIKNFKGGAIDDIKIFNGRLSALEVRYDFDPLKTDLHTTSKDLINEFSVLNLDQDYNSFHQQLTAARMEQNAIQNEIPEIMAMGDAPRPRKTFVLNRGRYDLPGQEVEPGVPSSLGVPFDDLHKNRLGLAEWLFLDQKDLVARVFVNRIWQQHFGTGLVKTAEDFGAQGQLPSHPDLLDWLSHYFIRTGWDIKRLHRIILTSEAYQRSSIADSISLNKDPENQWLARGPSRRLTAEMMRDNALAISGLLVHRIGGPSVYPYQPEGLWDEISNKSWRYPYLQKPGDGLYRRSLYTIWKRTAPPPSMLMFDVPDRSFCSVQRKQTNTPQQALALLNDPTYVEAARVLASQELEQIDDINLALQRIFRKIMTRVPVPEESNRMEKFFRQELSLLQKNGDYQKYLQFGETRIETNRSAELAALAITAHNLLNTYEAQMKK